MRNHRNLFVCAAFILAWASVAQAGFIGQQILGPLTDGSVVNGTTAGAADDNDGWDSGTHIFNIWDGGDNVYLLNWAGGNMTVTLNSLGGSDNDLFIYVPGSLDSSSDYSLRGDFDQVIIPAADPGQYYINIDTTFFSEGDYQLAVTPEPTSICLLGFAGMMIIARRRRP